MFVSSLGGVGELCSSGSVGTGFGLLHVEVAGRQASRSSGNSNSRLPPQCTLSQSAHRAIKLTVEKHPFPLRLSELEFTRRSENVFGLTKVNITKVDIWNNRDCNGKNKYIF